LESIVNALNAVPALFRLLFVFVLILLAIKRKWSLGSTFLGATVALGLIFAMSPAALLRSVLKALVDPKTLTLAWVVGSILVLSHSLEKSGQMGRLLENFKGLVRRPQVNMVIFPALIGLLPMPGGAIFSAPMVKNLGQAQRLSDPQLNYINYWYRHIWEYWWPLYPGILLTSTLAGVDIWHLVYINVPLTVVVVTAGYWPLRGGMVGAGQPTGHRTLGPFFADLTPILIAIVVGLAAGQALDAVLPLPWRSVAKELGLMGALALAIYWVYRCNAMGSRQFWAIVRQPELFKMVYMIAAILVFKGVLEDSGAVAEISQEMLHWSIPLMPITMMLPFLVGLISGITIAFVGATFPILISLVQSMGEGTFLLPYLLLAISSGFAGVLLSPLHLCLQMSSQYFNTGLTPVYRLMGIPLAALIGTAMIYFGLWRYLLG
jgi:integral membrane protein (TIGR00529 family)